MSPADGEAGASKRIEGEITTLRGDIGEIVSELDRRRREAFDLRLQLRRHPVAVSLAGLAVAVVVGGAVALLVQDARRRRKRSYKARQLRIALRRMTRYPERVARGQPPPAERILVAMGTAAATLLVKRALERAVPTPREAAKRAQADGGRQPSL